jgi:hypothetical protein
MSFSSSDDSPLVPWRRPQALQKGKAASSVEEMRAALKPDPTLVATAFKKRRFFLFSRRLPVSDATPLAYLSPAQSGPSACRRLDFVTVPPNATQAAGSLSLYLITAGA